MTENSCVTPTSFSECQKTRRNSGTGMDGVTRVIVDQVCGKPCPKIDVHERIGDGHVVHPIESGYQDNSNE